MKNKTQPQSLVNVNITQAFKLIIMGRFLLEYRDHYYAREKFGCHENIEAHYYEFQIYGWHACIESDSQYRDINILIIFFIFNYKHQHKNIITLGSLNISNTFY